MSKEIKIALNLVILLFAAYAVYLIVKIPQHYGWVSLAMLGITATFNFDKKVRSAWSTLLIGLAANFFVAWTAYPFIKISELKGDKFDIPLAVHFEETSFNKALEKARKLDKPVFVDFYASWCAPCLAFTHNVLTDEEVGKYMNAAFVNLRYDAEKGEGIALARKYNVRAYPTLLILDADGEVIDKMPSWKAMVIMKTKSYLP